MQHRSPSAPVPRGGPGATVLAVATGLLLLVSATAGCAPTDGTVGASGSEPAAAPTMTAPDGTLAAGTATTPQTVDRDAAGTAPAPPTTAPPTYGPPRQTSTTAATPKPPASVAGVRTATLDLVDPSRSTISRGRAVASTRSLPTTLYVPNGPGPFPLVVFAHGYRLGPPSYDRVIRTVAGAGYVVAAPSFPLADQARAGANLDRGDLPNQAGDVAFVISQLLGPRAGDVGAAIDTSAIGVVGHSDGADTALDVGYHPDRHDPRVKAVVAMNPDAMGPGGGSVGVAVPLLLLHGDRDSITPYANSQTVFGQVRAPRTFVTLLGADHLPPVQGAAPWAAVEDDAVLAFLDRHLRAVGTDVVARATRAGVSSVRTA